MKKYTIQDITNGNCAVINDSTVGELKLVMRLALPNDSLRSDKQLLNLLFHIIDKEKGCAKFINRSEGRVSDLIKLGYWKDYKVENYE